MNSISFLSTDIRILIAGKEKLDILQSMEDVDFQLEKKHALRLKEALFDISTDNMLEPAMESMLDPVDE